MQILLLGYSDIARRRVLPALAAHGIVTIDVASQNAAGVTLPDGVGGRVFRHYREAIAESNADLVWISTVNSQHAELAQAALDAGRDVVIDKPATTSLDEARGLVEIAAKRGRMVAEATVYPFHPQVAAALRLFAEAGSSPTQLLAAFSFPELPPANFRHDPDLGGGAFLDLGPYALSIGRVFFDDRPRQILCQPITGDRGFSLLITYSEGRSLVGHFGTTTGYVNRLLLLGPHVSLTIDRAFTTPPRSICRLEATVANVARTIEVAPADSFAEFFRAVRIALTQGDHQSFLATMLADAEARELCRVAMAGATAV